MGDLFTGHVSVALDEGTAFKIEELAGLERIISSLSKEVAFDYLADFHLLRAVPAEAAEFVVLVAEGGGGVTNNFEASG